MVMVVVVVDSYVVQVQLRGQSLSAALPQLHLYNTRTWFRLEALKFAKLPYESNWNACGIVPAKNAPFPQRFSTFVPSLSWYSIESSFLYIKSGPTPPFAYPR